MELWTAEEVATYLKMDPETVRRKAREKAIPSFHLGRWVRFRKEHIDEWIAQGCPSQQEQPSLFEQTGRTGA